MSRPIVNQAKTPEHDMRSSRDFRRSGMNRRFGRSASIGFMLLLAISVTRIAAADQSVEGTVDYESQIKPILESNCFDCHSEEFSEAGFRVDNRWDLVDGGDSGEVGIVPGEPSRSYLMTVLTMNDEDLSMPYGDDHLPKEEIDLIRRWIREGAIWPGQMTPREEEEVTLWSMQPIVRPEVPPSMQDGSKINEIDRFLQDAMLDKGLVPSPEATPGTLLRRVSVILTGLFPSPKELAQFKEAYAVDPNTAYEDAVDALLESPHFGERWAQHWLDVIRWGETTGGEANLYRKYAWPYRDYVIDAFNSDLPYDQFIREQLAGDVLGAPMATGFLVAGPNIPKSSMGNRVEDHMVARGNRLDQTIQTVSASVLGMTVGCARCHDHKFDPISIEDYYSMKAVFEDLEYESRVPEYPVDHPAVTTDKQLRQEIAQLRSTLGPKTWFEDWGAFQQVRFPTTKTSKVRIQFWSDRVVLDELEILDADGRNLLLYEDFQIDAIDQGRTANRPNKSLVDGAYGAWRSFQVNLKNLKSKNDAKPPQPWIEVLFEEPQEIHAINLSQNREYFYLSPYDDYPPQPVRSFLVELEIGHQMKPIANWFNFQTELKTNARFKSTVRCIQAKIEDLNKNGLKPMFIGKFLKPETGIRSVKRSPSDLSSTTGYINILSFPGDTRVLKRGEVTTPGDVVQPAGLEAIDGALSLESDYPNPERRVEFAKWLTSASHPLTPRVMVNRMWHHIFGRGLIVTGSDFGNAGAMPDHPELLDWLASEFISPTAHSRPWSVKRMLKMMVMSHAFRQSSEPRGDFVDIDADSIYLWRYKPRRVEAEVIRDNILKITGRLNRQIGGRGFNIYAPKKQFGHWHMKDNYSEPTWRRLLYQDKMRRTDDELFSVFDLPDCGQIRDKRAISTTPLQALNLLNSEFIVSQSEFLASRLESLSDDPQRQVEHCFELLFGRSPNDVERVACLEVAGAESLAVVCRALLNTNEFSLLN
ncbi:MAG: PSD1 and planctomycete cytochrome C domain-containing protein [Planctomycetota bacterium]